MLFEHQSNGNAENTDTYLTFRFAVQQMWSNYFEMFHQK